MDLDMESKEDTDSKETEWETGSEMSQKTMYDKDIRERKRQ